MAFISPFKGSLNGPSKGLIRVFKGLTEPRLPYKLPLKGLIRVFKGPYKALIRALKLALRPFKWLIKALIRVFKGP